MLAKQIKFPSPGKIELQEFDFKTENLKATEIAMKNRYSIISAGTELEILSGKEWWAPLPFVPGYGSVGEIIALGKDVGNFQIGDRVLTYGKHASHILSSVMTIPLPDELDSLRAVFTRMAAVSITAVRVSKAELGDYVAVYGLGLVGNFAAQLFTLAGCEVIGIDISQRRLEIAKECGISHVISPLGDTKKEIASITDNQMCSTVVEATGNPSVAEKAFNIASPLGELILLGSPRGTYNNDLTTLLNKIHLIEQGCITVKGAHEWRYPIKSESDHIKHSLERNIKILLRLIRTNKLRINELITHVLPPSKCIEAYTGLQNNKDEFLGVVFDWTKE